MKLRTFFLLILLAYTTTSWKTAARQFIFLQSATSQTFCSGLAGRGCSTVYNFTVTAKLPSSKLKIDRMWIGKESVDVQVQNLVSNEEGVKFKKNDSLRVSGTTRMNVRVPDSGEQPVQVKYEVPYAYEGEALIGYLVDKKRKYLEIKAVKQLPRVNYP